MERFAFGENWQNFSKRLTYERYLSAKQFLQGLVGDLTGKTFLDVGCGSGLEIYRWVIERSLSWLHRNRRLRIRYEKRDDVHQACRIRFSTEHKRI